MTDLYEVVEDVVKEMRINYHEYLEPDMIEFKVSCYRGSWSTTLVPQGSRGYFSCWTPFHPRVSENNVRELLPLFNMLNGGDYPAIYYYDLTNQCACFEVKLRLDKSQGAFPRDLIREAIVTSLNAAISFLPVIQMVFNENLPPFTAARLHPAVKFPLEYLHEWTGTTD